jgi:hypothetical protein
VNGIEVIPDAATVAQLDARIAGADFEYVGAHGAGVRNGEADDTAEEQGAPGKRAEAVPQSNQTLCVKTHGGHDDNCGGTRPPISSDV